MAIEDGSKIVNLEDLSAAFNAVTAEKIGIYSVWLGEVKNIIDNNPTLTTMDTLTQYIFNTYLLPKNKPLECVTAWAVTNTNDSRCVGANVDLATIYNSLTGVLPSYGLLTFERVPHGNRIIVTYTPWKTGSAVESKCPQIYATYAAGDNSWATGTQLSNTSGWYIKAATRVKGNAELSYRWGDVNLTPANLGLGTSNLNFTVKDQNISTTTQVLSFNCVVQAVSNPRKGHNISFLVRNNYLTLVDSTDSSVLWDIYPIRIKGNAESSYRTGDVILTPANIGLGSATNNLTAHNTYSGTKQTFGFSYTVDNSLNTDKNGHDMSLIIDNDDLVLWDGTNRTTTWSMKPYNTRVKGNAESTYRTGDVNLTPANIGAPETITMFSSAYKTWESIYNRFNAMPNYSPNTIYMDSGVVPIVTANSNTPISTSLFGTIVRTGTSDSNSVRIFARSLSGSIIYNINILGMTSSSQGTTTIYKFEGAS